MTHMKVWAKEGVSFISFIICTLRESRMLQRTYFGLEESMPCKYKKTVVFNLSYNGGMNTFDLQKKKIKYTPSHAM